MKKILFLVILGVFLLNACSEDTKSDNFSDVKMLDIQSNDTNVVEDVIPKDVISDVIIDTDDAVIVDVTSDILQDSSNPDINPDIYEDVVSEEDILDVAIEDVIFDAGIDTNIEDVIYEDIESDVSIQDISVQDAGTNDLGTRRGLLFSAREKFKTKPSIFYVDPEGGVPQKISPDLSDEFTRPFWAPDGNSFYFESSAKIYKTPFGKFEPVEICSGMDFAISPDEKLIALSKYVKINDMGEYDYELFIFNIETNKYTQITNFMDGEMENRPSSPSFSPDSKKILFSILNPTGSYDVYSSDLFIYDIGTGFLVNVTNEAKKIQAKVANRSAEWAPDINKYAYLHILYPESGYYLVDGLNNPIRISDESHNGIDGIAFSPNANALAIATGLGKGIKIIDLKGNLLYDLPIIDLEYIDNLSWK